MSERVELLPPAMTKHEREQAAFAKLLPELLMTHRGRYVAIHEGDVVGSGADEIPLIRQVRAAVGNVAIHVAMVTEEPPSPVRLPSIRVVRGGDV